MPRTTTTGDVRPAPAGSRYQPPARSDSSSGGGVFRSGPNAGGNIVRPSPTGTSPTGTSRGDATRTTGRSTTVDSRYRAGGTRADAPRAAETPRSSAPGRSAGSPAAPAAKPRGTTPAISDRYAAPRSDAPGVSQRTRPNANADAGRGAVKADANRGAVKPDAGRGAPASARPGAVATTTAGVRAPRLGGPNAGVVGITGAGTGPIANGSTGPIAGGATGLPIAGGATAPASCGGAFPDNSWCASSWGCNYWDPYCGSSWSGCGWGWGWGGCGFSFGVSWWWPCWSWSSCWWDHCYSDCWWSSCAYPTYVSSSYWWYPSSTYCPTYLYVPSTVIVADDSVYGGSEVVVVANPAEKAPDSEVTGITASLASKYVELGDFYFRQSRFTDAVGAYGKARTYAPDDASLHFVLADAVFAEGDYLYAAFLVGEGLRLDPGMASATTDKRTFYKDAATFDAQMAALDRHLERRPDDALAHMLKGYNLRFSGKPVEAIVAFRRALELDPGNRPARTFLDALEKPAATESVIVR